MGGYITRQLGTHASFLKGFSESGLRGTKHIIIDNIWPVEFDGGIPQILGWGCDILILASFEGG